MNGDARLVSELGEQEVSGLTLTPDERGIAIDFFALSFASGERLRYQYRLEGADEDWSPPTRSAASTTHICHRARIVSRSER